MLAEVDYKAVLKSGETAYTFSEPFVVESPVRFLFELYTHDRIVGKAIESP